MVRRVIEEDVATPTSTVVEDDGSWIGRTIVTLVVIALLVAGAIWLFNSLSDNDTGVGDGDTNITNNTENNNPDNGTDGGTDGGSGDVQPTSIPS